MGKGSTQARIVEPSGVALGGREHRTALALGAAQMPKLLVEAAAVLEAVHAARTEQPGESWYVADTRDRPAAARAWEAGQCRPAIAAEIDRFEKAAEQRLGGEGGIAAFLRSDHQGRPSLPGVEPRQGRALRELAHGLAAARRGRLDHQLQRAQDAAEQRKHQQQRPGTGTDRGSGCRSGCKQADGVND
jgi:hypothetical protein